MRLHLCVVGRLRAGPEHQLINDYLTRFDKAGRGMGLGPATVTEVEDKKGGGKPAEAVLLSRAIPDGAVICALDERGKQMPSPQFANHLARWRDDGRGDLALPQAHAAG